ASGKSFKRDSRNALRCTRPGDCPPSARWSTERNLVITKDHFSSELSVRLEVCFWSWRPRVGLTGRTHPQAPKRTLGTPGCGFLETVGANLSSQEPCSGMARFCKSAGARTGAKHCLAHFLPHFFLLWRQPCFWGLR